MTVKELKDKLNGLKDDMTVTIDLAPSGHVGSGTIDVKEAHTGFDWTHNQLVLYPTQPVDIWYEKCKECKIPRNCTDITSKSCYSFMKKFGGEDKYWTEVYYKGEKIAEIPYERHG